MDTIPNIKLISLTQGKFAIVDADDYDFLMQWKWHCGSRYAARSDHRIKLPDGKSTRKTIYMHSIIMSKPHGMEIDHINGDRFDNRKCNLRICTHQQNSYNRKRNKNSTYEKGVRFYKNEKIWCAQISYKKKRLFLGVFKSREAAALAYKAKALELHGEFANFS